MDVPAISRIETNRCHWYVASVASPTELAIVLNAAEQHGLELHSVANFPDGPAAVFKTLVTNYNIKGYKEALNEVGKAAVAATPQTNPTPRYEAVEMETSRTPLPDATAGAVPLGTPNRRQRRNSRA